VSAAVFTNLLKEERYAHFEARSVLLGKKGTGKTTVTRTTRGVPFLPSHTERASKWG
jgi:Mg-chelatase subunit ChlI